MQESSSVTASVHTSTKTVHLSPAACKSLNEVAAQLWIMAYHQQYTPKQAASTAEPGVEQITQVCVSPTVTSHGIGAAFPALPGNFLCLAKSAPHSIRQRL